MSWSKVSFPLSKTKTHKKKFNSLWKIEIEFVFWRCWSVDLDPHAEVVAKIGDFGESRTAFSLSKRGNVINPGLFFSIN